MRNAWFASMSMALVAAVVLLGLAGCKPASDEAAGLPKEEDAMKGIPGAPGAGAPGEMDLCNFKGGPDTAPVKVVAFYPGRHEDTLAAVKALIEAFPEKVQVEVVDWRTKEGRATRDAAGLTCAGVTVNGKNAFDLEVEGKREKVMFVRGMGGEWTEAQLNAAVKQELSAAK